MKSWGVCFVLGALALAGCSEEHLAVEPADGSAHTATAEQALVTGTLSASPNPCVASADQVNVTPPILNYCATTLNWTGSTNTSNYQIWVQHDSSNFKFMACAQGGQTSGSVPGINWIHPGQTYRFSLRATANNCSTPDPAAPAIATLTYEGVSASLTATSNTSGIFPQQVLVGSNNQGSTTLSWTAAYGLNAVLWRSDFDGVSWGPPQWVGCSAAPATAGTATSTLVKGHTYRFSLRPTSQACTTTDPASPEVASVTVQAVSDYIIASPDRCSAAPGGTCSSRIVYGTNSTAAKKQVVVSTDNGVTWQPYGCGTSPTGGGSNTFNAGTKYIFALRPAASCPATTPTTASATLRTVTDYVEPEGGVLKLGGAPLRTVAMNTPDLLWLTAAGQRSQSQATLADAATNGVTHVRIGGTLYSGAQMQTWRDSPATYWSYFDAVVADAKAKGIKLIPTIVWNVCAFPDLAGTTLNDMVSNPSSAARTLLSQYVTDLTSRYATESTIQMWELVNELDVLADVGSISCAPSVLTTDDAVWFMQWFGQTLRAADPVRAISSGNSDPRFHAAHTRAHPNPNPDWTADDQNMLESHLAYVNPPPIDVASVHFYNTANCNSALARNNQRLGIVGPANPSALRYYARAIQRGGKALFVGEANDFWETDSERHTRCGGGEVGANLSQKDARRNFGRGELRESLSLHLPLTSPWVWERRDCGGLSCDPYTIAPNLDQQTTDYIAAVATIRSLLGSTSSTTDLSPANAEFELDTNGDGLPDQWTKNGSLSVTASRVDGFEAKSLKLSAPAAAQGSVISAPILIGTAVPANAKLFATAAGLIDSGQTQARMQVFGYGNADGTGAITATLGPVAIASAGQFRIELGQVALPATTKSVVVSLSVTGGTTAGYAEFDSVQITMLN